MAVSPLKVSQRIAKKFGTWLTHRGSNEFYPGGQNDQRRFVRQSLCRDIADLMTEHRHRMLIGDGRYIHQAFPLVSGAVKQKADYVYGGCWRLQSHSKDLKWAEAVEADLEQIDGMLDLRGPGYSFRRNIKIESKAIDRDGDFFIILTENKETGFPQLQYLESHRIGSWENSGEPTVQEGRYRGRRIFNGVIVDDYMRPMAFRLQDQSRDAGYQDMPASAVIWGFDPEWFSQGRGVPSICSGILDWYDLAETKDAQKIKQKVNSALTLVESNETGSIDTGQNAVNPKPRSSRDLQTQLFDSGMIRYIKNGGNLSAHTANDPSEGWLKFTTEVQRDALFGMRWRREMYDGTELARAGARGVVNDVNCAISSRCEVLAPCQKRAALYVIAKRHKMGAYGSAPLPDDWYKVSFTKPAEFTVDEGRIRQADRDDLRAGLSSERDIVERRGKDFETHLRQRAKDLQLKKQIAEEHGLTPEELGTTTMPGDPENDTGRAE